MRGYRGSWFKDRQRSIDMNGRELGEAECTAQTLKAIRVKHGDKLDREMWIPRSALHSTSEVGMRSLTGKLVVKTWWAETRGL